MKRRGECKLWQIKTTLAHGHGRALRRLLADQQVSPAGLAFVPVLIETAMLLSERKPRTLELGNDVELSPAGPCGLGPLRLRQASGFAGDC
jgi:hypothetical protein